MNEADKEELRFLRRFVKIIKDLVDNNIYTTATMMAAFGKQKKKRV